MTATRHSPPCAARPASISLRMQLPILNFDERETEMPMAPRTRVLLIAALVFAALAALIWYLSVAYWTQPVTPLPSPRPEASQETRTPSSTTNDSTPRDANANSTSANAVSSPTNAQTPTPTLTPAPTPSPQAQNNASNDATSALASMQLLIPVAGVK